MMNPFTVGRFLVCAIGFLAAAALCAQEIRRPLPVGSTPNERARFLAGLPAAGDSPLYSAQNGAAYFAHLRKFGETWDRFQASHFSKQREWASAEMALRIPPPRVLYYMFSGPDFINATALFPGCETYILVGLESVGAVPPPEQMTEGQLAQGLANLRGATDTTLKFSFFITKDMKTDLERTAFRGVLPVLYAFLALSGNRIASVDPVSIAQGGRLVEGSGEGLPGARIRFRRGPEAPMQTLYYIRADLSDAGLKGSTASLLTWMRSFPPGIGYLKAASYLMHEASFSRIRDFLLGHCNAILQDDSGIPFRFFTDDKWRVLLYGDYSRPIEIFDRKFQPELFAAYRDRPVPLPLPFGTGYNHRPGESNLMLAVKRPQAPTPEPYAPPQPRGEFITPR